MFAKALKGDSPGHPSVGISIKINPPLLCR